MGTRNAGATSNAVTVTYGYDNDDLLFRLLTMAQMFGVLVFPGTGIQDNLADKARKLGIPVRRHR